MAGDNDFGFSRRGFLAAGAAVLGGGLAAPALANTMNNSTEMEGAISQSVSRNVSAFVMQDWRPYFTDLRNGAILCDLPSRAVHYWGEDGTYRLYPSSVPVTEDLTKRGRTEVVQKVVNPTWRPTPSMRKSDPSWPEVVEGGSPNNPLGPRALYLSWTYYRIHGTHDTRKIGRRSSNGCVGLYNEHIIELFELAKVGTQVYVL